MKKAALFCLILAAAFASRAQLSPQRSARFQFILDSVCGGLKIKGATAAVLLPGAGSWQGASGISEPGVPMDTNMHLGLGSNTKTYVAVLLLRLQELNLISLDDTIGTWFPANPNIPGQISVRQLLNHTSGLYNYTNNPAYADSITADFSRVWMPQQAFQFFGPPIAAPGAAYSYANTNYLLAGLIAESVSGLPLNSALQQYVYQPAGISRTFLSSYDTPTGTIPHVWSQVFANSPQIDLQDIGYSHNAFLSIAFSAGGLLSTVGDNLRFWDRLYSGQLLSPASMAQLRQYVPINANNRYGLGIFRFANKFGGRTILAHGGTGVGFINENAVDTATGICVSVLTNQDSVRNSLVLDHLVAALMREGLFPAPLSVGHAKETGTLSVHPNPASDRVYVSGLAGGTALFMRDASGRILWQSALPAATAEVPAGDFSPGLYLLEAIFPDGRRARAKVQVAH